MRVLYDHKAFEQTVGGVSRCFVELIRHLPGDVEPVMGVLLTQNVHLMGQMDGVYSLLGARKFPYKKRLLKRINQRYFQYCAKHEDYQLLHCTTDDPMYSYVDVSVPVVATFHDFIAEKYFRDQVVNRTGFISEGWLNERREMIRRASRIVCVSENTKEDLLRYYPDTDPNKLVVIYHGYTLSDESYMDNRWGKYILYVGARADYKNFHRFVEAVSPILRQRDLKLICTGKAFNVEESAWLAEQAIADRTVQMFVDEQTLRSLYHHAQLFVYPSLYEGFGIPLLEAMANGCPMAISNASCFPEVAGDAAAYFDPTDVQSMQTMIDNVLGNEQYRTKMIARGKERVKKYSWEEAAAELANVYKQVLTTKKI